MNRLDASKSGFERKSKRTHMREFLVEMNLVQSLEELLSLIAPQAPATDAEVGRTLFADQTMLTIHFVLLWFTHSDSAISVDSHDTLMLRTTTGFDADRDQPAKGVVHVVSESTHSVPIRVCLLTQRRVLSEYCEVGNFLEPV